MCCLISFDNYSQLHVAICFALSGCHRTSLLACNFHPCCFGVQAIFLVRLARNEQVKVGLWYGECQGTKKVRRHFRGKFRRQAPGSSTILRWVGGTSTRRETSKISHQQKRWCHRSRKMRYLVSSRPTPTC